MTDLDLVEAITGLNEEKKNTPSSDFKKEMHDWEKLRNETLTLWTELVGDETAPYPELLIDILRECTFLPEADYQIPLLASYLALFNPLCRKIPICILQSDTPGSGKSDTLLIPLKQYQGITPTAGRVTPAGFKRLCNETLFHLPKESFSIPNNEKPGIVVLEDVDIASLTDYDQLLFNALKVGCDRNNAYIKMASANDQHAVQTFFVFCPKYISTIHKIWLHPKFVELQRRTFAVKLKNAKEWVNSDYSEFYDYRTVNDIQSPQSYDWTGFYHKFSEFWNSPENFNKFVTTRKKLARVKNQEIGKERWDISLDWLSTGITCGFFKNLDRGIESINKYWIEQSEDRDKAKLGFIQLLETFISELEATDSSEYKPKIETEILKGKCLEWGKQGQLEVTPTDSTIAANMQALGYTLQLHRYPKNLGGYKNIWKHQDDKS